MKATCKYCVHFCKENKNVDYCFSCINSDSLQKQESEKLDIFIKDVTSGHVSVFYDQEGGVGVVFVSVFFFFCQ